MDSLFWPGWLAGPGFARDRKWAIGRYKFGRQQLHPKSAANIICLVVCYRSAAKEADNSFTILVSNPSGSTQTGTTAWSLVGIPGPVLVRDLLNGVNLVGTPNQDGGYQVPGPLPYNLTAYQSQLLKVTPMVPLTQYHVDGPNSKLLGSAVYSHANSCSDGTKAGYIGNGGSVVFGNVYAAKAGTYKLSILYFTDPARPGTISVNNGAPVTAEIQAIRMSLA